jgi:hypothetical protein
MRRIVRRGGDEEITGGLAAEQRNGEEERAI